MRNIQLTESEVLFFFFYIFLASSFSSGWSVRDWMMADCRTLQLLWFAFLCFFLFRCVLWISACVIAYCNYSIRSSVDCVCAWDVTWFYDDRITEKLAALISHIVVNPIRCPSVCSRFIYLYNRNTACHWHQRLTIHTIIIRMESNQFKTPNYNNNDELLMVTTMIVLPNKKPFKSTYEWAEKLDNIFFLNVIIWLLFSKIAADDNIWEQICNEKAAIIISDSRWRLAVMRREEDWTVIWHRHIYILCKHNIPVPISTVSVGRVEYVIATKSLINSGLESIFFQTESFIYNI